MAIEIDLLNILVIRVENKGYVIQADWAWFGYRGFVFGDWKFLLMAGEHLVDQDILNVVASRNQSNTPH